MGDVQGVNTPESIWVRMYIVKVATEDLMSRAATKRLNLITRVDIVCVIMKCTGVLGL